MFSFPESLVLPTRLLLRVFLILVLIDAAFLLLHLGAWMRLEGAVPRRLDTFSETSVVSFYSYGKWAVIATICALIWRR